RVPGDRAGRPVPGDRVAGRPAVVDRGGRDVRDQLLRVQLAPGGGGAATGAEGDCRHLRQRRPLHRRRALHRRGGEAARPGRLPAVHGRPASPAAGSPAPPVLEPWLRRWREEQPDGPYWRQGSLRPAYERIACPTMLVAGWADGYRNATFRVMERLKAPTRLLFGPWSHMAADTSRPGPRIDLVPEMVRWWDRWLRGHRNRGDEGAPAA